jgi:hypothetical protein
MVFLLKPFADAPPREVPPERRRVIVIGAGPTGISAAFHLGEHCLLLERRAGLEDTHDHSDDFALGAARGGAVGTENTGADGERPATLVYCSYSGEASSYSNNLIRLEHWQLPPARIGDENRDADTARAMLPQLRAELRYGACVARVSPSIHMLELTDGSRFVYDKLLCTIPLSALTEMLMHELARRIAHDDSLRFWLSEHDIEVADQATQFCQGDIDEITAGKRVAALINRALTGRFQSNSLAIRRGPSFCFPRLVSDNTPPTS